jgi:hypothetical protein
MTNESGDLIVWSVYERPSDFPDNYHALKHRVVPSGPVATGEIKIAENLSQIQSAMECMGLTRLNRVYGDDVGIVECWL